jgi:hypothetical protein
MASAIGVTPIAQSVQGIHSDAAVIAEHEVL